MRGRLATGSFRTRLRAFQAMRGDGPDPAFIADLEFLENRDLDLSVRIGAMRAFNALMVTIGTHPVSASPGAPLSLDAASQPLLTIASLISIVPGVISCFLCLRALMWGEEFDVGPSGRESSGGRDSAGGDSAGCDGGADATLRRRLFAAFVASIDFQSHLLHRAVRWTIAGGVLTLLVWAAIIIAKTAA